jgi:hypothetical protein
MPSKRPCSICCTSPVKFANARSASANDVGSSTAIVLPDTTNGAPFVLIVAAARALMLGMPLLTAASVVKVNSQLPPTKFTVSLAPKSAMPPMTRPPPTSVSVSGPDSNSIAGAEVVAPMLPELITTVPPAPASKVTLDALPSAKRGRGDQA